MSTGRMSEAERVLAGLLERAPDQRGLNYSYALVLTKLGRGDESQKYLERAVEVDPTFGPAIQQLVDLYQKQGEWEKAAALLQPLISEDPLNLEMQRQQAYYYLRGSNPEKALAAFKALVAADPKDTRSQFYEAEALNDLERYDEADKIYRKLLEKTPEDAELLTSFGLSQMGQHKYDEASKTFRSLLALPEVPDNLQVLAKTQLALIDLEKGNYSAAVDTARGVLVFHDKPNTQAVGVGLDALKKQKRYNDALLLLQPLVDKYGSDPYVNGRYIELLVRSGAKDKAAQMAATQAKFGSKNAIAAAEAYIAAEEYAPAVAMLRSEAAAHPEDLDLQFELGSALERSGDKAAAEKIFQAILKDHPDHAATLNYLGYMWADSGVNLDKAAEMLNKAVSEEPRNGAYIDSLGWVYFRQGKLDEAEKYLTDATKLLPRDATVHEHLGDVFARRGDYNRALVLYRLALHLEPEAKDEAKLRSKIAEVEKQQTAQRR
jgi:tetratricopeptide (TPR) repeat protein